MSNNSNHIKSGVWTTGAKMGIGTAYTYNLAQINPSKVWFTITHGAISEVMYPTIDMANVKELKYIISCGDDFIHDETVDCFHNITLLNERALGYKVISTDKNGRYRIIKKIITDPFNNTLVIQTKFEILRNCKTDDYHIYLYYVPRIKNSGTTDSARFDVDSNAVLAWDRDIFSALRISSLPIRTSINYIKRNELLDDLKIHKIDWSKHEAQNGRIAIILNLPVRDEWTVALGFGMSGDNALHAASTSLTRGFNQIEQDYIDGWNSWCESLDSLEGNATEFYYLSAMIIKAHEDKTHRGAIVASLSLPWGNLRPDKEEYRGYRYVWPRDLYHSAMGLLAIGDKKTVFDILAYLDEVMQQPDGSFPQNTFVDGTPYWQSIQMDEVAVPILIAWWLRATERYQSMVKPAADYIVKHGPFTLQERWEENSGYSPATIAAEIAGLVCAAELALQVGDTRSANFYLSVADDWQTKIDSWCFTTNGIFKNGRYYLRISPNGNPNSECILNIANGGGSHDQREVIDPSFLELVRLGIKPADDPHIIESLSVIDQMIKVETPCGPGWYRYNFDKYGETTKGDNFPGQGKLWTLLTGERGMYELSRGNIDAARQYLKTMTKFANEGGMLPEQVWEDTGNGTGSATPLVWSHSEYILLLKSLLSGEIVDRPKTVFYRYGKS